MGKMEYSEWNMEEKLIQQLTKIRERLTINSVTIEHLEEMKLEAKTAFDSAIKGIAEHRNIREEIRKRRAQLKKWRISVIKTFFPIRWSFVLSAPFIYGMIFPAIVFHFFLEIYHHVCFRLYDIPRVNRKDYFINDRQLLPYLNWFEKLNCVYCSYYGNLLQYAAEIAGRTERYWCPIKYSRRIEHPHSQYVHFVDYLDGENFRTKAESLRSFADIKEEDAKACDFVSKHKK